MTLSEFHTYQEQTFDSYIKTVIANEAKNAKKEIARRTEHEISISQLVDSKLAKIVTEDKYELEGMTFSIEGDTVTVNDVLLGRAIAALPPLRREVILLSYFLDKKDQQIAALMHLDPNVISKRRYATLRRLKDLLEALDYER